MEKIDFVVLGARVREKREEQGISQEQLSELSGLSTVYICGAVDNKTSR